MNEEKTNIGDILTLVFKGLGLAMGVAVVVLNVLGVMDMDAQITLLGIGLFCTAIGNF